MMKKKQPRQRPPQKNKPPRAKKFQRRLGTPTVAAPLPRVGDLDGLIRTLLGPHRAAPR